MDADVFDKTGRNRPASEPSHRDIVMMANDLGCRVCGDYEQLSDEGYLWFVRELARRDIEMIRIILRRYVALGWDPVLSYRQDRAQYSVYLPERFVKIEQQ